MAVVVVVVVVCATQGAPGTLLANAPPNKEGTPPPLPLRCWLPPLLKVALAALVLPVPTALLVFMLFVLLLFMLFIWYIPSGSMPKASVVLRFVVVTGSHCAPALVDDSDDCGCGGASGGKTDDMPRNTARSVTGALPVDASVAAVASLPTMPMPLSWADTTMPALALAELFWFWLPPCALALALAVATLARL